MQVLYLGWEDLPEEEIATHSSILAWEIPWTEGSGKLQSMGSPRVRHTTEHTRRSDEPKKCVFLTFLGMADGSQEPQFEKC